MFPATLESFTKLQVTIPKINVFFLILMQNIERCLASLEHQNTTTAHIHVHYNTPAPHIYTHKHTPRVGPAGDHHIPSLSTGSCMNMINLEDIKQSDIQMIWRGEKNIKPVRNTNYLENITGIWEYLTEWH